MAATVESIQAKIAKLHATLARHQNRMLKKQAELEKAPGPNATYWIECDIEELEERIDATREKIAKATQALEAAEAAKVSQARQGGRHAGTAPRIPRQAGGRMEQERTGPAP